MEKKYKIGFVPPARGKPVGNNFGTSGCRGTFEIQQKVGTIEMARGKPTLIREINDGNFRYY